MDGDRSAVPPDEDLVRAVAAGSQESLAILYDRYAESLFRLAVRLTNDRTSAEEIVQETFLALWNRAELFKPTSGSLATWLRVIARNRALDRLRAAARRPRAAGPLSDPLSDGVALEAGGSAGSGWGSRPASDPSASPERAIELAELRSVLRDALAGMPDPERRVILLAYQEGLSQSEIADRLGWPLGTVKTRTRRALQRLRAALAGVGFALSDRSSEPAAAETEVEPEVEVLFDPTGAARRPGRAKPAGEASDR